MFYINIHGFLKKIKKPKIQNALQYRILGKRLSWQFGIPAIRADTDPKFMVVLIGFEKKDEADRALDLINGFLYFDLHTQSSLRLYAVHVKEQRKDVNDSKMDEFAWDKNMRPTRSQDPYGTRDRSRSPRSATTVTNLDMEIELLQKERMLIVEQRKLLLEKKRLELLKDFEPTSINDLERYAAAIDNPDEDVPQPIPRKPSKVKSTPVPVLATRAILKQMKDVSANRRGVRVSQPLFFTLRRRMIEIIKGKSDLGMDDIIKIYREIYPIESDEALLDQIETQVIIAGNLKSEMIKGNIQKAVPGPSDINKVEVKNQKEETKVEVNNEKEDTKKQQVSEINEDTNAEFTDNELDDWLEDENVDQQDGKVDQQDDNGEEKNTTENVELNVLEKKEV